MKSSKIIWGLENQNQQISTIMLFVFKILSCHSVCVIDIKSQWGSQHLVNIWVSFTKKLQRRWNKRFTYVISGKCSKICTSYVTSWKSRILFAWSKNIKLPKLTNDTSWLFSPKYVDQVILDWPFALDMSVHLYLGINNLNRFLYLKVTIILIVD